MEKNINKTLLCVVFLAAILLLVYPAKTRAPEYDYGEINRRVTTVTVPPSVKLSDDHLKEIARQVKVMRGFYGPDDIIKFEIPLSSLSKPSGVSIQDLDLLAVSDKRVTLMDFIGAIIFGNKMGSFLGKMIG